MYRLKTKLISVLSLLLSAAHIQAATLTDIKFAELPGERGEVRLSFDSMPTEPTGYSIEQPARIVLDFSDVDNQLSEKKYSMSVGEVNSAVVVEGGGRTRLIINLDSSSPYSSRIDGNDFVVEVGVSAENAAPSYVAAPENTSPAAVSAPVLSQSGSDRGGVGVRDVDFRRGELGEGKVIIKLTDASVKVDIEEVSKGIEVKFLGASLPSELHRKLDVVDFATPVSLISSASNSSGVVIGVETSGEYDYLAYQADNEYVVSVKPLTRQEIEEKKKEFAYVGDRLSLNFQNIPVRNVLQLIADFTSLNLVASDTVSGNITLRLENVPWDQALDIVLKTKGLDKRQIGNVLMVAPAAEIAERERQEIATQKQLQELAPLRTEYIRIRYANARELFSLFMDSSSGGGGGSGAGSGGDRNSTGTILSERGQAIVDERTNSIILTDTEEKIEEFKRLIDRIDIPVRQVMIEARLVIANSDFRKELGVRMSATGVELGDAPGDTYYTMGANQAGALGGEGQPTSFFYAPDTDGDGIADGETSPLIYDDINVVDLGVFNPAGSIAWNVIGENFLLGLELSALQESGFAEIVSQPKVITGDKQQATIQSGTEIPYQEESASGGTTTSFKEAVLKLDVTPQITPDNRVIMDLKLNQDSISGIASSGVPILDITQLETQVLVADGETIVLGGIYQTETLTGQEKVPLLGDIPFIGRLFRKDINREDKREMLMFITPRIMSSDFIE